MSCFSKGCHLWALALALLLAFPLSGKTVVKMATLAPIGSPWHNLLIEMGQAWRDATDGEVILRIYPGGVAGDERDMIRKIRIGQLHAAAVTIEGLTEISRDMNVFYIPMLVNSFSELDAVRKPLMHELENDLSDGNQPNSCGGRQVSSRFRWRPLMCSPHCKRALSMHSPPRRWSPSLSSGSHWRRTCSI